MNQDDKNIWNEKYESHTVVSTAASETLPYSGGVRFA